MPFRTVMVSAMLPGCPSIVPSLPAMELLLTVSDAEVLLTYTSKQTAAQRERENASVARAHGIESESTTLCDEL